MTPAHILAHSGTYVVLFFAAMLAGALNSVAGGGSFISFPALMTVGGVAPKLANATNTIALWPGSAASVAAYRRELTAQRSTLITLGITSLVGGIAGAELLAGTPEKTFIRVVPWLLLCATLLFAFGGKVTRWARERTSDVHGPLRHPWLMGAGAVLLQLVIATYGGYFGGGIGMLMLALLALMGMEDIHAMNALKTLLATCINGVAVVIFIWRHMVVWPEALLMVVGAIAGGYAGAHYAMKLPPAVVRGFVLFVGFTMTIYFFVR